MAVTTRMYENVIKEWKIVSKVDYKNRKKLMKHNNKLTYLGTTEVL